MKITFPHLGNTDLAARLLFHEMGINLIVPEMNSRKTLERGVAISPEEMCVPFKIMAGNLADAFEKGADTVIMPATAGPCRLGEYAELLNVVLSGAGMPYNWILIESPGGIGVKALKDRLGMILSAGTVSKYVAVRLLLHTIRLVRKMDRLGAKAGMKAGTARKPRECQKILRGCMEELQNAASLKEGARIVAKWDKALGLVAEDPKKKPVRVLLVGEIYSLIEPFASRYTEEKLMEMGVSVARRVTVSWWIGHTLKEAVIGSLPVKPYRPRTGLFCNIGGYARETVRESAASGRRGYDGVIQIFPTGCMPEIVAKSILSELSEEKGVKVLNLIFDEMDGDAGYITRVEAFVDMLERRAGCAI